MPRAQLSAARSSADRFGPHWKGHLLLFDPEPPEPHEAASGARLLLIVALAEGVLGPRLGLMEWLGVHVPPPWLRVPLQVGLVLALVTSFARLKPSQLGLRSWAHWSTTEKTYFVQVFLLANVLFTVIFSEPLRAIARTRALWGPALVVFLTSLLWGFYQELIYRGILQTELVRRWRALVGILVANGLYTFGPLHFYHFAGGGWGESVVMFLSIFIIGLFFGLLFKRSGNLWIVGIFHGLGDWYIVGVGTVIA